MNTDLKEVFLKVSNELKNNSEIRVELDSDETKHKINAIICKHTRKMNPDTQLRLSHEFLSWGPLEDLLKDDSITEIIINGPSSIWYEQSGNIFKHHDYFLSPLTFNNFTHRLSHQAGILVDLDQPCANGDWGNFRVHIVHPPLVNDFIHITLRRHPDNPWTLEKLEKAHWAPTAAINILNQIVIDQKNILIVGPTGSGKTSILNALLQKTKPSERTICIEDTSEIRLPNLLSTKLLTRSKTQGGLTPFTQSDLIIESLRMRPERLIMGEIRGPEAKDFVLALATGHKGCMSTLHAADPHQALWRLELLIQMGASDWSLETVRGLIDLSLDYIVVTQQIEGKRKLTGIYKLAGKESFGFLIEPIFKL